MRLRRETGDFDIVIESGSATIEKGLNAECLIGAIIVNGANTDVVTSIATAATTLTLKTTSKNYTYTIATGAVAAVS